MTTKDSNVTLKNGRPEEITGETRKVAVNCGNMYITLNKVDDNPFEVFFRLGKPGSCPRGWLEVYGKWVTDCLKNKRDIERMIKHCKGVTCRGTLGGAVSCQEAIAEALSQWLGTV